jgi:hypothetical protein
MLVGMMDFVMAQEIFFFACLQHNRICNWLCSSWGKKAYKNLIPLAYVLTTVIITTGARLQTSDDHYLIVN